MCVCACVREEGSGWDDINVTGSVYVCVCDVCVCVSMGQGERDYLCM